MKYLHTRQEHYRKFINKYKTDRLNKNLKLYTESKTKLLTDSGIVNEIFNTPIKTQFNIHKYEHAYKIDFNTKSGEKYRLDIIILDEKDKGIVNHLAFSLYDNDINNQNEYEKLTGKNEMIEVLNRIHYIIIELVKNNNISNYFCIGGSDLISKNKIYEYFLKVVVGEDGFEKLNTDVYGDDMSWGLYFKI